MPPPIWRERILSYPPSTAGFQYRQHLRVAPYSSGGVRIGVWSVRFPFAVGKNAVNGRLSTRSFILCLSSKS